MFVPAGAPGTPPWIMRRAHCIRKLTSYVAMADGQQQLCFSCDENVRLEGDFLCRSCKEEYRKCYECGERERNHPFKLCSVCYQNLRDGGAAPIPASTSAVTTAASHTSMPLGTNLFTGGICRHKDSVSHGKGK